MGGAVGVFPERLGGGGFQHFFGPLAGDLAQSPGGGPGELLGFAGEDFLEFLLDVDVFVELVDQVFAEAVRIVELWSSLPLVLTQSPVFSAWRSIQIAKTLRKARTEPSDDEHSDHASASSAHRRDGIRDR